MLGQSPYALATPVFPFRGLALLAGRAPLGGPRETAIATLVAARLAAGAAGPAPLEPQLRAARAEAARLWMTSVALSAMARAALRRVVDASAGSDPAAIASALAKVGEVTAAQLDRGARLEIEQLIARFRQ